MITPNIINLMPINAAISKLCLKKTIPIKEIKKMPAPDQIA
jgi:hypothetical protein